MKNEELRISPAGEALVGKYFKVLDKGYVGLVTYHGTDALIDAAARTSYQRGTRSVNDTARLVRYLWAHRHTSPLEQVNFTFHVKMPLYIVQQLLRHRTARLNQESHRYSEISYDFHLTAPEEWRLQSGSNKQSSEGTADEEAGAGLSFMERWNLDQSISLYKKRLEHGVAREQARKDVPHSIYSQLFWQMDLKNMLHFLSLRCDSHAQKEIRDYANVMAGFVQQICPITFKAWYDYSFQSVSFSLSDRKFLDYLMREYVNYYFMPLTERSMEWPDVKKSYEQQEDRAHKDLGLSNREYEAFWSKLDLPNEVDFSLTSKEEVDV